MKEKKMNRQERRSAAKAEKKARKNRKNIYKKYGIEYKNGKIFSPINGGMWITPPLVNGNDKIGKGAWHFSTLPGKKTWTVNIALTTAWKISENKNSKKYGQLVPYTAVDTENPIIVEVDGTCACTCMDKEGKISCYAFTGNYNYDTTKAYLAIRTILAREYPEFLEKAILAQIEAENIELCRIHAAGDFFNKAYAEMWQRIAENC